MDDSSSKPFFIALLAGGALLLAGIAIGVVGTTAAVKSEWLVLGRSSAESQSISAPKLEYEENQGVDSILCIDGRAYKVRLGTQELMHRLEELPRTQSIRQYQLKPIPCAALHKS
ncbi:TPA: hypothetical protein ACID5V_005423 [Pseudomonas aeruginosa]|uniref:Uncharacterized protein n=1 Tax=Pseudomonas aeruginosa TaxID=287 RepID=A0A5P9W9S4_PSEAI|nr:MULTISPECIES: hypothetical protein [Pseudomonas aeruginosa group]EKW4468205.1 hypothetical protein [Pseudomonas aeruginosa]EKW6340866.1 hypothetical protein [Pseudomonas aeruginosa]EKX5129296.1 hypothetical protein [Pseudomonas aeruginosa]ERX65058.1 hypothetical protein P998_05793 [Pseudomonas aeruginosa E2]KKJ55135.1 hypothetical protein T648_03905 [Pseudomonas aeruginosa MRSN 317]